MRIWIIKIAKKTHKNPNNWRGKCGAVRALQEPVVVCWLPLVVHDRITESNFKTASFYSGL